MFLTEAKLRDMIEHAEDAVAIIKADDSKVSIIPKEKRIHEFETLILLEKELLRCLCGLATKNY